MEHITKPRASNKTGGDIITQHKPATEVGKTKHTKEHKKAAPVNITSTSNYDSEGDNKSYNQVDNKAHNKIDNNSDNNSDNKTDMSENKRNNKSFTKNNSSKKNTTITNSNGATNKRIEMEFHYDSEGDSESILPKNTKIRNTHASPQPVDTSVAPDTPTRGFFLLLLVLSLLILFTDEIEAILTKMFNKERAELRKSYEDRLQIMRQTLLDNQQEVFLKLHFSNIYVVVDYKQNSIGESPRDGRQDLGSTNGF